MAFRNPFKRKQEQQRREAQVGYAVRRRREPLARVQSTPKPAKPPALRVAADPLRSAFKGIVPRPDARILAKVDYRQR